MKSWSKNKYDRHTETKFLKNKILILSKQQDDDTSTLQLPHDLLNALKQFYFHQ